MSDQIRLSGTDANMSKDKFKELIEEAKSLDPVKVNALLAKAFIIGPDKNVEEKTDEELIAFQYALEETVHLMRMYLAACSSEKVKRSKKNKEAIAAADKKYKPAPIPKGERADWSGDPDYVLAEQIAESQDISIEEALLRVRGK